MPPEAIGILDDALNAGLVSRVTGSMEDLYGDRFPVDLVFDWAPWVEKLTGARRRAYQEPSRPIVKALDAIKKEIQGIRGRLEQAGDSDGI